MDLRTGVDPNGRFRYGIHRPEFEVDNLRAENRVRSLGHMADGRAVENRANFPSGPVAEQEADWIYEVPNPFPFRGTTYISKRWADRRARRPQDIALTPPAAVSFHRYLRSLSDHRTRRTAQRVEEFRRLPAPLRLALATSSDDPRDLEQLARLSCRLECDPGSGRPTGMGFRENGNGAPQPEIFDRDLFEAVANSPFLPADYRHAMVLRPGVQGTSEIVGDWPQSNGTHVFEYLRRNSYIPWGHYAANMADDSVRYSLAALTPEDMTAMRHLYYQRTYVRLARSLGIGVPAARRPLSADELENLRLAVLQALPAGRERLRFTASLWGWNFGFDFAPSGYRLHASHQQIHQQYALIPETVERGETPGEPLPAFACGDLVADFIRRYRRRTGQNFFDCYQRAIYENRRMTGSGEGGHSLVVAANEQIVLFVPKAQTSQWELQLMPLTPVGNVLESAAGLRRALDQAMWTAVRVLGAMGARLITTIEYAGRFGAENGGQRLLYSFLPRLPQSPGAFSESQLRWINGHYPEDFAAACRRHLDAGSIVSHQS